MKSKTTNETAFGYPVFRSKRKTFSITVRDGNVAVRVPNRMPHDAVVEETEKHLAWLERTLQKQRSRPPLPSPDEQKQMKMQLEQRIPPLVAHWARIMGVCPASVRITSARTRYGSCSGKNHLCFSLFCAPLPDDLLEYIVVHELAHCVHHDHSAAFWNTVAAFLPDATARRQRLREQERGR